MLLYNRILIYRYYFIYFTHIQCIYIKFLPLFLDELNEAREGNVHLDELGEPWSGIFLQGCEIAVVLQENKDSNKNMSKHIIFMKWRRVTFLKTETVVKITSFNSTWLASGKRKGPLYAVSWNRKQFNKRFLQS